MSAAQPKLPPPDDIFTRRRSLVLRAFLFSSLLIILVEVVILLLSYLAQVDHPTLHLIDGMLLLAVILPLNYFYIVRPLSKYIDEHRRTSQELLKSSEVLERLFTSTDIMFAYLDADFNFIRVNQAYASADQREPGFFPGLNFFTLFPNPANQAVFQKVVETGEPFSITERPLTWPEHPEIGVTYWNWTLQAVKGISGKVDGVILSALDVTESKRTKDELREMALFPALNPDAVLRVDADGIVRAANPVALEIGLSLGAQSAETIPELRKLDLPACIASAARKTFETTLGERVLQWRLHGSPELGLVSLYSRDITKQKQTESIIQTRLRVMQYANAHTLDELLQFTLDEIEALTGSSIGFFHFLEADQKTLWLQAWSTKTLSEMCTAEGKDQHYAVDEAGVWADAVRQRQAVVHNDYPALPDRRGGPEGHAPITRELVVPVTRAGKIVAVFGMGNKAHDYTPADVELVETLADFAWDVIERQRAEIAIRENEQVIQHLYEAEHRARHLAETLRAAGEALSGSLSSDTVLETLLDHLAQGVAYQSAHLVLYDESERLVMRKARGEETWPPEERMLGLRFDLPESSFILPLLRQRMTISLPDVLQLPETDFFKNHPHIRSWLGIPLLAGEKVIGVCGLEHSTPGFFSLADQEWAESVTALAAAAVHNAWLYEQVQENRARLRALSRRLVEVQEQERFHIARELHDEAGQGLASVMVGLRMIERDSADPAAVIARCQEVKQIADEVLENLHRLSMDLRPAALDHLGLVAALRQHAEMVSDLHKLPVQFAVVGSIERLPGESETAIYRIVQEALTNIVRHASATRVDILLERRDGTLVVVVEDNGVGIDPTQVQPDQLGVVGMRERAEMLGGTITIESAPGKGTTIFLEVPCPSAS